MNVDRRRVRRLASWVVLALFLYVRCAPRSAFLPLATHVDGPDPAKASAVVVFLHGRGGGLLPARRTARALREAGLPADVSIVLLEARTRPPGVTSGATAPRPRPPRGPASARDSRSCSEDCRARG